MTLNTEYVKSMQGILKILEFVSTSDLELYNVSEENEPKCKKTLKSNNFRGLKCIDVINCNVINDVSKRQLLIYSNKRRPIISAAFARKS